MPKAWFSPSLYVNVGATYSCMRSTPVRPA